MLGEQICWILLAEDFANIHAAATDSLLYPQQVRVYVAKLPKTFARSNAYRGR